MELNLPESKQVHMHDRDTDVCMTSMLLYRHNITGKETLNVRSLYDLI